MSFTRALFIENEYLLYNTLPNAFSIEWNCAEFVKQLSMFTDCDELQSDLSQFNYVLLPIVLFELKIFLKIFYHWMNEIAKNSVERAEFCRSTKSYSIITGYKIRIVCDINLMKQNCLR